MYNDKGKMPSVPVLILALALAVGNGCSIKEDRSLCPCSLILDFSEVDLSYEGMTEIRITAPDGFLYYDGNAVSGIYYDMAGEEAVPVYGAEVPKSMVAVSVTRGVSGLVSGDGGVVIPLGYECPPVFMHHSVLDAVAERREDRVFLHKDYCRVGIRMLSGDGSYPFRMTVEGNVNGFYPDRTVSRGDFSYSFSLDAEGMAEVRVPRQTDNSLVLVISDGDTVLREFALGEFIAEAGYDWTADNLEDIDVSIDYAHSDIAVEVEEWSGSFEYDVVI